MTEKAFSDKHPLLALVSAAVIGWALWLWLGTEKQTPQDQLFQLQLTRDIELADLHRERENCRALAIETASLPDDTRKRDIEDCWAAARLSAESAQPVLRSLEARIADLKRELGR